jgi:hypothetical protein
MLFLQGARDGLAEPQLMTQLVTELGSHATLRLIADADQ